MNKFELISKAEYDKMAAAFRAKNGVLSYLQYDELKLPCRATRGSAGYDFFSPISFRLKPGGSMLVPTFVKCSLNFSNFLLIVPRSSYGFKYRMQLDNTVAVIDRDYYNNETNEGHILIQITNDSRADNQVLTVNKGDAFAQGIIMGYDVVEDDKVVSTRMGGIGSTTR